MTGALKYNSSEEGTTRTLGIESNISYTCSTSKFLKAKDIGKVVCTLMGIK